jgi:hypothetical protein
LRRQLGHQDFNLPAALIPGPGEDVLMVLGSEVPAEQT